MDDYVARPPARMNENALALIDNPLVAAREMSVQSLVVRYLWLIRRHKWIILAAALAGVAIALVVTVLMTREYTAAATIEIAREEVDLIDPDLTKRQSSGTEPEFYATQYGLLQSRSLAERVAKDLRLGRDITFLKGIGILSRSDDASSLPARRNAAAESEMTRKIGAALLDRLDITPARLSRLVVIEYTDPDPAIATRIANAWARLFIQTNIERKFEATAYARKFLEQQLDQLRVKLDASERELVQYASDQRIIEVRSAGGAANASDRPITSDDLVAFNAALSEATAQRIAAEAAYRDAQRSSTSTTTSVTNATIAVLRQQRAEAAAEYAKLRAQFEASYPPALALQAQVDQLDRSIGIETARIANSLQGEYRQALARESELRGRVEGLKNSMIDLRRRSIQYNILQRDADTNRTLYDGLLQRYKQIGVAGGIGTNNISIVDRADMPEHPSSPRPLLNVTLGLIAGLLIGFGIALLVEDIDEAISDPNDIEHILGVPNLGAIPAVANDGDSVMYLVDPRSMLTEAYLTVKTNLQFATANGVPKCISITSTKASEGKSTTALGLASILARQGFRVVVIDGDMRKPSIHKRLDLSNTTGLSSLLSGNDQIDATVQESAMMPGVSVITAGPHPPNPADLLSSARTDELIALLTERFDHVIIDSPPMLGLADAPLLASAVEGVVFVIEANITRSRLAQVALARLRNSNPRILGAILTKFEAKKSSYGYGYEYGYSYGFAYGRQES